MLIGSRVLKLRLKRKMNQKQLAKKAGIAQATISRIESGQVKGLRIESLKRLAEALDVPIDYLVNPAFSLSPHAILQSDKTANFLLQVYSTLPENQRKMLNSFLCFLAVPHSEMSMENIVREWLKDHKEPIVDSLKESFMLTVKQAFSEIGPTEKDYRDRAALIDRDMKNLKEIVMHELEKNFKEHKKRGE